MPATLVGAGGEKLHVGASHGVTDQHERGWNSSSSEQTMELVGHLAVVVRARRRAARAQPGPIVGADLGELGDLRLHS